MVFGGSSPLTVAGPRRFCTGFPVMPRRAPEEWIVRPVLGNPVSCPASRTSRPDRGGGAQRTLHGASRVRRAHRRARAGSALRVLARASARASWRRHRARRARAPGVRGPGEPGWVDPVHRPGARASTWRAPARRGPRAPSSAASVRRRCLRWWTLRALGACSGARGHRCRGAPRARRRPHRGDMGAPTSDLGLPCDGGGREIDPDASGEESSSTRREICPP